MTPSQLHLLKDPDWPCQSSKFTLGRPLSLETQGSCLWAWLNNWRSTSATASWTNTVPKRERSGSEKIKQNGTTVASPHNKTDKTPEQLLYRQCFHCDCYSGSFPCCLPIAMLGTCSPGLTRWSTLRSCLLDLCPWRISRDTGVEWCWWFLFTPGGAVMHDNISQAL